MRVRVRSGFGLTKGRVTGFRFKFGIGFGFGLGLESGLGLSVGLGLGSFRAAGIHRVARRAARRAGAVTSPAAGAARLANLGPVGARHVVLHLPARVVVGSKRVHSGWRRLHQCRASPALLAYVWIRAYGAEPIGARRHFNPKVPSRLGLHVRLDLRSTHLRLGLKFGCAFLDHG